MPTKYKILFDENGNHCETQYRNRSYIEKDNYEWYGELTFDDLYQSKYRFTDDIYRYIMFPTEFLSLIKNGIDVSKPIIGTWTFLKKGPAFGIRLVSKKQEAE